MAEPPTQSAVEPLSFVQGRGVATAVESRSEYREFAVEVGEDALMRLNVLYFPGWTLYVDGKPRPVAHDNAQGVMDSPLERGRHTVRAVFEATPIRVFASWISIVSLLALLLLSQARRLPRSLLVWRDVAG